MSYIYIESYKSICDSIYETGFELPNSGIVYCTTDHIDSFIRDILEQQTKNKYVVVSGASDFSVFYSKDINLLGDRLKWVKMDENVKVEPLRDYIQRARVNVGRFLYRDKFHTRCYSWTNSSFPVIPDNIVCWFAPNFFITEPNLINLPFGIIPEVGDVIEKQMGKFDVESFSQPLNTKNKENVLYCNWVDYTNERVYFREWAKQQDFCLLEQDIPKDKFLSRLSSSKFVLCPAGNSMGDSYRILETLYVGSIPVIEATGPWSYVYHNLPVIHVESKDIYKLNMDYLRAKEKQFNEDIECCFKFEKLTFEYWKEIIESCRSLLV